MLLEVTVPTMLVALQGIDPVIVKLPPERVPIKLKALCCIEFVRVPVSAVPDCETAMLPMLAAKVVAPLMPRPTPVCVTVAVPEKLP